MHCISQQVVTHCWGFGSLRVHCLLCCSSSRRTWTYRRPGFFSPRCNLNSHPALCSCRRNWTASCTMTALCMTKEKQMGEPGKRREKRWKRVKYVEEVFAFVKCASVRASACPHVYASVQKPASQSWSTDSQCALMETMCSLRHGVCDKLFIGYNTRAIIGSVIITNRWSAVALKGNGEGGKV